MDRNTLVRFVRARRLAVLATTAADGRPQAAVVGIAATDAGGLVFDTTRGIKLFADQAYYAIGSDKTGIAPFLLKKDAEEYAAKNGSRVLSFDDALKAAVSGG